MRHFIFNLSKGNQEQAASFLRVKMWALGRNERHCSVLAPGDLVLFHVAEPRCEFVGRAALATAFQDQPLESGTVLDDSTGWVLLTDVEEWTAAVPLRDVVQQVDPKASNPHVQGNAEGFRSSIVLITAQEYGAAVALSREATRR